MSRPEPLLHLALMRPEIPGNTGNVGRLAVGIGARLHLVHPLGFDVSDKAARRAGIDHWANVDRQEHVDDEAFWAWVGERRVHLFSSHGQRPYTEACFQEEDVLLFGCETKGLPKALVEERGAYQIPMVGRMRSLNLSNAVAVVAYRALEQVRPELFGGLR